MPNEIRAADFSGRAASKTQYLAQNADPAPADYPWPVVAGEVCLVRCRRPDGKETILKVPAEHLDRLIALASGEFGDKSILEIRG